MPTTYTHYVYGQEVFQMLPTNIQKEIHPFMGLYNIGVHGPDILFYYRSFCKNKINQYGVKIHKEPMEQFLRHAFSVYRKQEQKQEAYSYLAGFMTHFILDSSCHPYIRKRIRENGISHTEIETDWDYLMMERNHLDPIRYKTATHILEDHRYARVIAPYYNKKPVQVHKSLVYMKLILNHMFRSYFGVKRQLAVFLNEKFLPKQHFQHYFRKTRVNMANLETCEELTRRYEDSKQQCAQMIEELYYALESNDLTFCEKKRFERNFS